MKPEHRNEVVCLYVGYFATLALGLVPGLAAYAIILLALQLFYAIIRYVSTSEAVFRSHMFNEILAVGVSFAVFLIIAIQIQTLGGSIRFALTNWSNLLGSNSTSSFGYTLFMMILEALFAIFWPIVLIFRGLYLLNTGRVIYFGSHSAPHRDPIPQSGATQAASPATEKWTGSATERWLASAVLADGQIVKFELNGTDQPRVIGRKEDDVDIVLRDPTVGRRHARISANGGSLWISDVGSTNGTFVNGRQIGFNPVQLHAGDKVQMGAVTLTISAA